MIAEYDRRRRLLVAGLNRLGLHTFEPRGAFYAFPNITRTGFTSKALEDKLLNEAGVASLSGTAFGALGEGYLRFSYANSMENIEEALRCVRATITREVAVSR